LPTWISSNDSPLSESLPRPPLPANRFMSSVIGEPPETIDPETCTEVAASEAAFVAVRISAGDLSCTPLPAEDEDEEDEPPPQPARIATSRARAANAAIAWVVGR